LQGIHTEEEGDAGMINDVIHEEQMENEEDMKTRGSIL